uniref:Tyrosine-protein phosphatase domain-containing protein n=1 Tax=Parastrongyloides trichosuri TaxID=131310 RepID=A0A0N4ZV14_PARTI
MKPHEMGLSIIFGILIMILFFFRFGLPIYQIIKKQFKEQDEAENAKITSIFENIDIEEEIKKSYLDYKKQINEGEKMKLKNECKHTVTINIKHFDLEFDKYFIKKVIVIDNFDLYASTEIFNICINEKIDGIITLTPSFNYANAEHEDDHFHEYAPGYYPEIFNIHVIGLKEKQCTQYPGIHLRDYEVKDIEIAKTFTDGYSIVQVCVSNWNLNNNFPTPYYISHILNIIETVELENIIIHGTRLGKRAKILGAVIYLIHNLINIALEDVDIDFSVITKFINQYENLSCGGELNENEFNITIVSLIGHLLRKGYIRSKAIESKLNNFFKKINS